MNTKINYLYRDGCNYKQHNEEIVAGTFTEEQIDTIIDCLDSEEYFIPSQVNFTEIRFGELTEDDTCWFELSKDGFEETNEPPTTNMTPEEVVNQFLKARENWDDLDWEMYR